MKGAGSDTEYNDSGPEEDVNLHQFLGFAFKRLWLVAACTFAFLFAGLVYLWLAPRIFQATAIVEVPLVAKQPLEAMDSESQDFRSEEILKTIEKNLQRISLFRRVMQHPEVKKNAALHRSLEEPMESYSPDDQARLLESWSRVKLQNGTRLINVSVEHPSPHVAEMLANAIVDEFIRERIELQSGSSAAALRFLREEAGKARAILEESEKKLVKYHGYQDSLALKGKIDSQNDLVLELSQRYRDKHPKLLQARGSLNALVDQLHSQLMAARSEAGSPDEALDDKTSHGPDSGALLHLDHELQLLEKEFNLLSREVESNQVIYDSVVSRLRQADVNQNWELVSLRVVETAFAPTEPTKPNKMQAIGASVVLGGGMGLSLVLALCVLDRSIRTVEDASRILNLPVIGAIPGKRHLRKISSLEKAAHRPIAELKKDLRKRRAAGSPGTQPVNRPGRTEPVVILSQPAGEDAEALRTLRAELGAQGPAKGPKSFLVTSALSGEGKSFVASNVAVSFAAEEGSKTLLIDANLREPAAHILLDTDSARGGLVEALSGDTDPESLIVDSGVPQLDLLPAGNIPSNPAEILSGSAFPQLLKDLAGKYDRIIIDTTRATAVADTLLLAPHVDFTVLVIRARKTPRDAVHRALELLTDMGSEPVGLVLNCSSA